MGKLVVYLTDGTTRDVPLDKERITIGRRADNDVCLPYPAVSGEHAQVVTILADSFLEDLGSTNGTLVNGRAIAKHVLRDHDQIDIGRQRLTYLSDNDAKAAAIAGDPSRQQIRGLPDKVEPARPMRDVEVPAAGERLQGAALGDPLVADLERNIPRGPSLGVAPKPPVRIADMLPPAVEALAPRMVEPIAPRMVEPMAPSTVEPIAPRPVAPASAPPSPPEPAPAPVVSAPPRPAPGPSVKVLSGAGQGRIVPFPGPELTVGRVGVQVAIVRKVAEGYVLIPVEGKEPPRINGATVAPEGSALHPGDTFEVAGVRLELSGHA
ncbi:MAG: FHA domain-containing protein [Burkholderiales bacterium]